jgi:zinc/manganese transport system substrate-binding protein
MSRPFTVLLILLAVVIRGSAESIPARKLQVLVSIPPIFSWVASVGGERIEVASLLPENTGPHDYQFRPRDLARIRSADLIFLNGLGLEDWLKKAIQSQLPDSSQRVVELAGVFPSQLLIRGIPEVGAPANSTTVAKAGSSDAAPNPHLWLDPQFATLAVGRILEVLIERNPESSDYYRANAKRYLEKLEKLDADFQEITAHLAQRKVVTFHDAFPYLCQRYQLQLAGVIEDTPGTEPGPRHVAELLKVMRKDSVGVLFVEPQFDSRLARQLARDLKIGIAELDTLETGPFGPGEYERGMRRNLATLAHHLKSAE